MLGFGFFLRSRDQLGSFAFLPVEALLELLHPSGRIDESRLTGVERMRCTRNIEFEERVLFAIFPLDGIRGFHGRAGKECEFRVFVLEDNEAIIIRVDFLFHESISVRHTVDVQPGFKGDDIPIPTTPCRPGNQGRFTTGTGTPLWQVRSL